METVPEEPHNGDSGEDLNEEDGNAAVETEDAGENQAPANERTERVRPAPVWMQDYVVGNASFIVTEDEENMVAIFIAGEDLDSFEKSMQHEIWR